MQNPMTVIEWEKNFEQMGLFQSHLSRIGQKSGGVNTVFYFPFDCHGIPGK
jgi:hypothetical protein